MHGDSAEKREGKVKSAHEILLGTIWEASRLEKDADRLMEIGLDEKSTEIYRNCWRERAQLVVDLPNKIEKAMLEGFPFPEDELNTLKEISVLGITALEKDKNTFMLALLLKKEQAKTGDPNHLEEVYRRVYGVTPEIVKRSS